MNLTELLVNHKKKFRQKLIEAIAKKNQLTHEQIEEDYQDFIQEFIEKKYREAELLIDRIKGSERPVLLSIRRSRSREDKCKICEANQPNIDEIAKKYGGRIAVIEAIEDNPDGSVLYHIIFHEEAEEKKVPLTALITGGEIVKFWAGKTVDAPVYERYIKKMLG